VGKSSLVLRFCSNDFNENTSPTIGAAFLTQSEWMVHFYPILAVLVVFVAVYAPAGSR